MNVQEMSNEFDILYNQVNSNTAPGIDEYEKSVFLTKAQDEIVRAYFDPRGNKFQAGFNINDIGQLRQYDFSSLIVNKDLSQTDIPEHPSVEWHKYDPRSYTYTLPNDAFLVLNESVIEQFGGNTYIYQVIPISYMDYTRLMQKPYQYPPKRQVWKIISSQVPDGSASQPTICEILGKFKNTGFSYLTYRMRYVRKPNPIILVELSGESLSIDGQSHVSPCQLPVGVHHLIVQRAVELCTAVYNPQALSSLVGVGNASETNLGIVPSGNNKEKD